MKAWFAMIAVAVAVAVLIPAQAHAPFLKSDGTPMTDEEMAARAEEYRAREQERAAKAEKAEKERMIVYGSTGAVAAVIVLPFLISLYRRRWHLEWPVLRRWLFGLLISILIGSNILFYREIESHQGPRHVDSWEIREIEGRLQRIERKANHAQYEIEDRLDEIEDRLDEIEDRLDEIEDRLDEIEDRLDEIEQEQLDLELRMLDVEHHSY